MITNNNGDLSHTNYSTHTLLHVFTLPLTSALLNHNLWMGIQSTVEKNEIHNVNVVFSI